MKFKIMLILKKYDETKGIIFLLRLLLIDNILKVVNEIYSEHEKPKQTVTK